MENLPKQEDLNVFAKLLKAAFLEMHEATMKLMLSKQQYIPDFYKYPTVSFPWSNGMPSFGEITDSRKSQYFQYSVLLPHGGGLLGAMLSKTRVEIAQLPEFQKLRDWITNCPELFNYFDNGYPPVLGVNKVEVWLGALLANAVERVLNIGGVQPVSESLVSKVLAPIFSGIFLDRLKVTLVVPVLLTRFDFPHFRLDDSTYIVRLSTPMQLARSNVGFSGSGASKPVALAATHAFVSTNWELPNANRQELNSILYEHHRNILEGVDDFFAALRTVRALGTGYAQVLLYPRHWVTRYYANFPSVYGVTVRKYPSGFDKFRWTQDDFPIVSVSEMERVATTFQKIRTNNHNSLKLALRRLNNCLLRDDADDVLLDAVIGLELLLSDKGKDAVTYKLQMRAAALAKLIGSDSSPDEMKKKMNRIYAARSALVHGTKKKSTNKDISHVEGAKLGVEADAIEVLQQAIRVMIEHPRFLEENKIDNELLLGITSTSVATKNSINPASS